MGRTWWFVLMLAGAGCGPEEPEEGEACADGELDVADDGCSCHGEPFEYWSEETCACVVEGFACTPVDGCRGACD